MKPVPYRAGNVAIGLLWRQRRSVQYAQAFEHHLPGRSYARWVVLAVIALCLLPVFWR